MMEAITDTSQRTRLVPLWRLAGFYLGFLPTVLLGPEGLYATVEPVETFVVEHYTAQFTPLEHQAECPALAQALRLLCEDEAHHRDDAAGRMQLTSTHVDENKNWSGIVRSAWSRLVCIGSAAAAEVARWI